jgi:hypothetical protein
VRACGFPHRPPWAATLHTVLRGRERERFEAHLGAWAEGLLGEPPATAGSAEASAREGKTLRGRQQPGVAGAHLLAARAHRVGLTRAQQAVEDQTTALPAALDLLRPSGLAGRIGTLDALLTQRPMAQPMVEAGGDSVMVVKAKQPQ